MSQTISVALLRDLLFHFPNTAELDAAAHYEAGQLYAGPDRILNKQLVPATVARQLSALDPEGTYFYVQLKSLPPEALDRYASTPEYGVVWTPTAWRESVEFQLTKSAAALARAADYERRAHAESRIDRIVANIQRHFPSAEGVARLFMSVRGQEDTIKFLAESFEKAYHEQNPSIQRPKLYEEPTS